MTEADREIQKARELVETASVHLARLIECCRYQEERARRWKGATVILLVLCLMLSLLSLSGCLTPAKLTSMSQRADVLSQGAKTKACAEAAAKAAEVVVAALEAMSAPAAMKAAEVACLECVKDKDCADDQECVSGHCQKRKQ